MLKVIKPSEKPLVTVFVPLTREWALDRFLPSLDNLEMPWLGTEVYFYIDTDNQNIINRATAFLEERKDKFNGSKILISGNPAPTNTRISIQRNRIIEMKERIKKAGVWKVHDLRNPTIQKTLEPPKYESLEPITGGGFYCYLTLAYLYQNIKYRFFAECFGPDVCYVMDVLKEGYKAYVNWTIKTIHITPKQDLLVDGKIVSVVWKKDKNGWQLQPYHIK